VTKGPSEGGDPPGGKGKGRRTNYSATRRRQSGVGGPAKEAGGIIGEVEAAPAKNHAFWASC